MTHIDNNQEAGAAREVASGVYQITVPTPFAVGPVNLYLITGETPTLVDVGPRTDAAWEALHQGLEMSGHSLSQIKQIVLTHHHVDHSGMLERVRQASGAKVYCHPYAIPFVEMDEDFLQYHDEFFHKLYVQCGVPQEMLGVIVRFRMMMQTFAEATKIDGTIRHGETLPHLPEWKVLTTPGHAQDHVSFLRESDRVMIAGDHIIQHISSNAFIEPPLDRSQVRPMTLVQYRTSMEMCLGLPIELILPGHGELVTNHHELITERLQNNWKRTNVLRGFLQDGEKTAYELAQGLFPTKYQKELPLVISETLGHLDLLTMLYQVETTERDGVIYYSL
ncbi:MBL fold metallo-hydrolase [Brevibacillus dissolubilis]|uniref:MBL fold metallo-hydrolase n=1 Tax=Brevibacillus dissolubilis TaxID=1844116 RepID=UPI0021001CC3|nr:MBL fold metallo-hydrolase [Brevibacillus dissolubilis]